MNDRAVVETMLMEPVVPLRLTWLPTEHSRSGTIVVEVEPLDAAPSSFGWRDPSDVIEALATGEVESVVRRRMNRMDGEAAPLEPPWARQGWFAQTYVVHFGPMKSPTEVLEAERPRRFATKFGNWVLRGRSSASFEPDGDGTRVTQEFETVGRISASRHGSSRAAHTRAASGELEKFARLAESEALPELDDRSSRGQSSRLHDPDDLRVSVHRRVLSDASQASRSSGLGPERWRFGGLSPMGW